MWWALVALLSLVVWERGCQVACVEGLKLAGHTDNILFAHSARLRTRSIPLSLWTTPPPPPPPDDTSIAELFLEKYCRLVSLDSVATLVGNTLHVDLSMSRCHHVGKTFCTECFCLGEYTRRCCTFKTINIKLLMFQGAGWRFQTLGLPRLSVWRFPANTH